ncbi:MAG: hypothetical protein ACJ72W_14185 [Actinoallomurus sp.]
MPTAEHEAVTLLFRNRPQLAADLLGEVFNVPVPEFKDVQAESGDFTEVVPSEFRADVVVVLRTDQPVLAVVVEVQRGRDPRKRWSWPLYLTSLRARMECPAVLLVVCVDAAVASWCAKAIPIGHPGWALRPLVVGPDSIPVITDADEAENAPELAVLSAMAHGSERFDVLDALHEGVLYDVDDERARLYADVVLAALRTEHARSYLEARMIAEKYEYQSSFAKKYFADGEAHGEARGEARGVSRGRRIGEVDAILAVLDARGITITDEQRVRIEECTDLPQLQKWVRLAAVACSADELFA